MKPWMAAIAVAALGSGMYALAVKKTESPSASRPRAAAVSTEPEALAPAKMGGLAPVAIPRPERPRAAAPADPIEDEKAGSDDVEAAADHAGAGSAPSAEDMRDHIEIAFLAERPVAASRDLARGLEKGVRAVLPAGSSVTRVECRSALCRVETVHPSLEEFREFVHSAYLTLDATRVTNGPVFASLLAEPVQGKPVVAVAYVGGEGTVLPMPGALAAPERP